MEARYADANYFQAEFLARCEVTVFAPVRFTRKNRVETDVDRVPAAKLEKFCNCLNIY